MATVITSSIIRVFRTRGLYLKYSHTLNSFSVLYQSDSYKDKGRVFYDVNKESAKGTTAIASYCWTDDGTQLALMLADKGSDVNYVHVSIFKYDLIYLCLVLRQKRRKA
jgi:hypothetical protein